MASQVDIANMALAKVGDFYISSMTEGTKQATYVGIFWDICRDSLLASYPWNFAMGRAQLALLAGSPVSVYNYRYQLPNDCLRIIEVSRDATFDGSASIDYRVEGREVLTNETALYVKYIRKVTDTTMFTPLFNRLLACDLAVFLAEPLGAMTTDQKQLLAQERQICVDEARDTDFAEGFDKEIGVYNMLNCRDT